MLSFSIDCAVSYFRSGARSEVPPCCVLSELVQPLPAHRSWIELVTKKQVCFHWLFQGFHHPFGLDVRRDLLMISVNTGGIAGRTSFTTAMRNLSFPGALYDGND